MLNSYGSRDRALHSFLMQVQASSPSPTQMLLDLEKLPLREAGDFIFHVISVWGPLFSACLKKGALSVTMIWCEFCLLETKMKPTDAFHLAHLQSHLFLFNTDLEWTHTGIKSGQKSLLLLPWATPFPVFILFFIHLMLERKVKWEKHYSKSPGEEAEGFILFYFLEKNIILINQTILPVVSIFLRSSLKA